MHTFTDKGAFLVYSDDPNNLSLDQKFQQNVTSVS